MNHSEAIVRTGEIQSTSSYDTEKFAWCTKVIIHVYHSVWNCIIYTGVWTLTRLSANGILWPGGTNKWNNENCPVILGPKLQDCFAQERSKYSKHMLSIVGLRQVVSRWAAKTLCFAVLDSRFAFRIVTMYSCMPLTREYVLVGS